MILKARDLIHQCPGLTYRKLDYWCKGGCFGDNHANAPAGTRRRFTGADLRIAQIINQVSLAFQTDKGGHADLVNLYTAVGIAARDTDSPIRVELAPGIELCVDVPQLAETT